MSKRFVYVPKNHEVPARYYPGSLDIVIAFPDERRPVAVEGYVEIGTGVAFAQCHWDDVMIRTFTLQLGTFALFLKNVSWNAT